MDSRAHPPHGSSHGLYWGLMGLALLLGLALCQSTLAAAKLQSFHIEAGDATLTLNEFSRQSNLQLLFDYNLVRGRHTRAVDGELEPATALRQMLIDTGLAFDFVNDRTLAVTLIEHPSAGAATAEPPTRPPRRAQIPQIQTVSHGTPGSADLLRVPRSTDLDEVTILGTHVHGEPPVGEHVVHLGRQDINDSPTGTVQDFLRTFPQTFGGGPTEDTHFFSAETNTNSGLGSGINLRGLGAKATLVLINGKRMAPSGSEGAFSDIENIPLAAVDHIDILSDGASALYGSDAVGGVVNFVMRDTFTGGETLVRGGPGSRNTLDEYQIAQTLGKRWDSGNGMVSLEFYKRGALPAYTRRYANSNLTPYGGRNFDLPYGNPATVEAGGQTYAVPLGQTGTHLAAADLVPGTQNLHDVYDGFDILPSQKRWSLYAAGKQSLTDDVTLFGNALVSRREAIEAQGGSRATLTVTDANPFYVNPAGGTDPVAVDYNFRRDLGTSYLDVAVANVNLTLGTTVALGAGWQLNLYGNYAREKENQLQNNVADVDQYTRALLDTNPDTALNPFGDGSHTNPATLNSIRTSEHFYVDSQVRTADVTLDGPIAHLPGGDLKLALGADHRNQTYSTLNRESLSPVNVIAVDDRRNVTAAVGEVRIPLFGKDNSRLGFRRLELSVAGRYETYSDFGDATTPKLGIAWSPLQALSLRGTWGRSIRAPTLAELDTKNNFVIPLDITDTTYPGGSAHILVQTGKEPHLTVERARTWTAGLDIDASRWVTGLTFSATYFNIVFRDRIEEPALTVNILDNPNYASIVSHNPTAAAVAAVCSQGIYAPRGSESCTQSGPQAVVDLRGRNLTSVSTSGIDLNASYERSWSPGTLRLRFDGTYLQDFTEHTTPTGPAIQLLNTQNNPINLKLRGLLSWQQHFWGAALGVNFQNHYTDTISEPNRNIAAYTTCDLQLRYAPPVFGTSVLQNTLVELNAINVFNRSPPFLNNATARLGYDQENADPYGRMLSVQLRKSW